MSLPPQPKCRRFRFSLRAFLVATLLLGCGGGYFVASWLRARHEYSLWQRATELKFHVSADTPDDPWIVRGVMGNPVYGRIHSVELQEPPPGGIADLDLLFELSHLHRVSLRGPWVDDRVAEKVLSLPNLESVSFSEVGISTESLERLAKCPQVKSLGLSKMNLTDADFRTLSALSQLQSLILRDVQLSSDGLVDLARLTELRRLVLDSAPELGDEHLAHLDAFHRLESLSLMRTDFSGMRLAELSFAPRLKRLELLGPKVTNESLQRCGTFPQLEDMQVGGTGLTDISLDFVAQQTALKKLSIPSFTATPDGLNKLQALTQLQSLALGPDTSSDSAEQFAQLKPGCKVTHFSETGSKEFLVEPSSTPVKSR
jgi:hypothetical protein